MSKTVTKQDVARMQIAIELAQNNLAYPFGAVIYEDETDQRRASGWNQGKENPTWHGEIVAINDFFVRYRKERAAVCTLYTTAEPCPMCQSAILWSGFSRVVFGTSINRLQQLGWNQIDIRSLEIVERTPFQKCEIVGGACEAECDLLFQRALRLQGR